MKINNFIDTIRFIYNKHAADGVEKFFEAVSLPLPGNSDEVYRTYGGGYLIFVNPYAVAVRITDDQSYPLIEHPSILQPLARKQSDPLRIAIMPGIHAGSTGSDKDKRAAQSLRSNLKKDNIDFWDAGGRNIGWLPSQEQENSEKKQSRTPVIIDEDALAA